jgi:hypothetical protein
MPNIKIISKINDKPKFRAWYKPDATTSDGMLKFEQSEIDGRLWFALTDDIKYPFEVPFLDDDWIVEQFTGFVDSEAHEIFLGDICLYSGGNSEYFHCEPDTKGTIIKEDGILYIKTGIFQWPLNKEFCEERLKVIDNIHQYANWR